MLSHMPRVISCQVTFAVVLLSCWQVSVSFEEISPVEVTVSCIGVGSNCKCKWKNGITYT